MSQIPALPLVRQWREVTQRELADLLQKDPTMISRYETGYTPLSDDAMRMIADYLRVSLGLLRCDPALLRQQLIQFLEEQSAFYDVAATATVQ